MKILLTTVILALAPIASFAMCGHDAAAQTCAAGFTWDADTGACVEVVSG